MLLTDADNQRPWRVNELNLDIGDEIIGADAIADLHASGLLQRRGEEYLMIKRARSALPSVDQRSTASRVGATNSHVSRIPAWDAHSGFAKRLDG